MADNKMGEHLDADGKPCCGFCRRARVRQTKCSWCERIRFLLGRPDRPRRKPVRGKRRRRR